jgi:hypothetical protein
LEFGPSATEHEDDDDDLVPEMPELTQPSKDSDEDSDKYSEWEDDKEPVVEAIAEEKEAQQKNLVWR